MFEDSSSVFSLFVVNLVLLPEKDKGFNAVCVMSTQREK